MEVVAGVASVVGILGFTGQAVTGLLKLKVLLNDAAAAKETVSHVLGTIDLLRSTLKEVERVVRIIETLPQHQINGRAIPETGALKYQTKACARDVTEWISAAKMLDPRSRQGIKAFLRKIKVATGKENLQSLGEGISSHQQRVGIGLSLLGSSLDVLGIHRLDNIDKSLTGLTEAHLKLNDLINGNQHRNSTSKSNEERLVALLVSQLDPDKVVSGNASEASLQSIHESISSLVSSVSQLVAKLSPGQQAENFLEREASPVPQTLVTPQWGCDSISGIEEAFEGDMCIYCCKCFAEQGVGTDWRARGQHLAREHYFGACNLGTTFSSWMSMEQHLSDFHDLSAKVGKRDIASRFSCPRRSLPFFERNVEDKTQVMKIFDEHPAASHILSAGFAAAMENSDIMNPELQLPKTGFRGSTLENDGAVKKKIHSLVDSGRIDSMVLLLWQIRQKLAYLFEELVVDERDETPGKILDLPSNSPVFNYTSILGSMLLIFTEELEARKWRDKIEPLFTSSTVPNTAQSLALNDRINPWLLTVLRHSNNTRIIVATEFGPEIKNPSDIFPWISSAIQFWFTDGTAITGGGIRLVSDGAIDSRDNLLESPVASQDASGKNIDQCSPQVGGSGSRQSTKFMLGGSSNDSAASLKSELAAKRSPGRTQPRFTFGGSSSGESVSSCRHAALLSKRTPMFTFQEEVATRTISEKPVFDDDVIKTDEDEIDESAIDDDDSSDWEDSIEDSSNASIDERTFFQRVDSRPNLISRRSLITTMPHQNDRDNALATAAAASTSLSALQRSRTSSSDGPSLAASPDSEDNLPLMMKKVLKPISENSGSAAQSIIQRTINTTPHRRALSPRTTRRNVLASDFTVSLRQHLLWERQQKSKTTNAVVKQTYRPRYGKPQAVSGDTKGAGNKSSWDYYFRHGLDE